MTSTTKQSVMVIIVRAAQAMVKMLVIAMATIIASCIIDNDDYCTL